MPLSTIRDAIAAQLAASDPGSKSYAYRRWITDPEELKKELQPVGNGPIRVWMFWVESIAERMETFNTTSQSYVFGLRLYYSLSDAAQSEIAVTDLVQTVRTAFRAALDLSGAAFTIVPTTGSMQGSVALQLENLDLVTLGGVLCHEARLRLGVEELVNL